MTKDNTKHTPGPFTIQPISMRGHSLIQWDGGRRSLQAETEVVTLWAAAPELLEALKKLLSPVRMMVSSLDSEPGNQIAVSAWSYRIQEAQAAIAKAEGREVQP